MKPIIFDVDGVLLDWEQGFQRWALNREIKFTSPRPTSWDLCEWMGGLDKDTVFKLIQDFNKSEQFADLWEITEAAVFVRALTHSKRKFFTLSCFDSGGKSVMNRAYNLHRKFGNVFEGMFSLPLRESKHHVLQNLYDREGPCYFIEDNPNYALEGDKIGHICFVMRRLHNKEQENNPMYDGLTWVDNLHQIRELIEKDAS